ncbi:MAG: hypothetical protein KC636_17965 [Myxococcales bacterium]|nr:hypothetical protein [Myxococcales bacterium]
MDHDDDGRAAAGFEALTDPLTSAETDALRARWHELARANPGWGRGAQAQIEPRPARRRLFWTLGAALAAAAAVTLFLIPKSPIDPTHSSPRGSARTSSSYTLEFHGGELPHRGGVTSSGVRWLTPTSSIALTIRPETTVTLPRWSFAYACDEVTAHRLPMELTPLGGHGAMAFRGDAGDLGLAPGRWTIVVAVGDGEIPAPELVCANGAAGTDWARIDGEQVVEIIKERAR